MSHSKWIDKEYSKAIEKAVTEYNIEEFKQLQLNKGISDDDWAFNFMLIAANKNLANSMQRLISAGYTCQYHYDNVILNAASYNSVDVCKLLLDKASDEYIIQAFTNAVHNECLEVIRCIYATGKIPKDTINYWLYYRQWDRRDRKLCKLLINLGADLSVIYNRNIPKFVNLGVKPEAFGNRSIFYTNLYLRYKCYYLNLIEN